jgi:pyridoxamine 5'-phosphate oxidase
MASNEKTNPISHLAEMRETYMRGGLDEADAHEDPIVQFKKWFSEAFESGLKEANAMTLATVTPEGRPAARIVLLKEVDQSDFIFYTNYESRKGRELEVTPYAALIFYWGELERQVRVEGEVRLASRSQSETYFRRRPRGHQLSAWASQQSRPVEGRAELEKRLAELEVEYGDAVEVPLPECWGGYRVTPRLMEFWQGRPNRMHDRIEYVWIGAEWTRRRLWP